MNFNHFVLMCFVSTAASMSLTQKYVTLKKPTNYIPNLARGSTNFSALMLLDSRTESMVAESDSVSNYIFSPLGVVNILAILRACSDGDARLEFNQLPMFQLPDDELARTFQTWNYELGQINHQLNRVRSELSTSNMMVVQHDTDFQHSFFENRKKYNFVIYPVDFRTEPEAIRRDINDDISYKTHGLIDNLLYPGDISSSTQLVITSTVYFQAQWQTRFLPASSASSLFHLQDGTNVSVPMMTQTENVSNYILCRPGESTEFCGNQSIPDIAELTFKGGDYKMVILSPNHAVRSLMDIETRLPTELDRWRNATSPSDLTLTMPKLQMSHEINLKRTMTELGLRSLSRPGSNAFRALTKDPLQVTKFVHKTKVEIGEKGVTMASAGVLTGGLRMVPSSGLSQNRLFIDHPFLFFIEHIKTETIVFLGRVTDPR